MALATYRVTGMTCEHCVHAVSEQLKNLGEVTDVTVTLVPGGESGVTYLEVASGVTALILLGRYFEERAKQRSGAALRALLSLGAQYVAVLRDGPEVLVTLGMLAPGVGLLIRP